MKEIGACGLFNVGLPTCLTSISVRSADRASAQAVSRSSLRLLKASALDFRSLHQISGCVSLKSPGLTYG